MVIRRYRRVAPPSKALVHVLPSGLVSHRTEYDDLGVTLIAHRWWKYLPSPRYPMLRNVHESPLVVPVPFTSAPVIQSRPINEYCFVVR
jgi:hypothetical protein